MKVLKKLFVGIQKIFKSSHPIKRQLYAVTGGKYLGEFFVFIEESDTDMLFLSLPSMEKRAVPRDKFNMGINTKILDPVEKLSNNMYDLCKAQYKGINN